MSAKSADFEFLVSIYRQIADKYHNKVAKQVRKYSELPYTVHTDEVEAIVREVEPDNIIARAAAHGHDIYEDVLNGWTPTQFKVTIGVGVFERLEYLVNSGELSQKILTFTPRELEDVVYSINDIIVEVSNRYTSERYPQFNRKERKKLEREKLAGASGNAQTVKLADILNNTANILSADPEFAEVYLREKAELVPLLNKGNPILFDRATRFLAPWS